MIRFELEDYEYSLITPFTDLYSATYDTKLWQEFTETMDCENLYLFPMIYYKMHLEAHERSSILYEPHEEQKYIWFWNRPLVVSFCNIADYMVCKARFDWSDFHHRSR